MTEMISATSIGEYKNKWIKQLVDANFALMPLFGETKVPVEDRWSILQPDPTLGPGSFPSNYGIVLQDDLFVLDIDPKSYHPGDDAFIRLRDDLGLVPEDMATFTVRSREYSDGREGLHVYFKKPKGVNIKTNSKKYTGIQALSAGHFVVGPGSVNPDADNYIYKVLHGDCKNLKEVPVIILNEFIKQERESLSSESEVDSEDSVQRYLDFLETREPAVEGSGGDHHTYLTACAGRDLNLSEEMTLQMMWDNWNDTCSPPWTYEDLGKKVINAYRYSHDGEGNLLAEAAFTPISDEQVPETTVAATKERQRKLDRKKADEIGKIRWHIKGKWDSSSLDEPPLQNTIVNVVNFFRRPHYGSFTSDLFRTIRYNIFTRDIEIVRPLPWHMKEIKVPYWTDIETVQLSHYLSLRYDWNPPKTMILDGVVAAAQAFKYHPLWDYLYRLKWDGKKRIDYLLPYYAGADDNPYTRAVGRKTMIGLINRIMAPGPDCKHDTMVILEGEQGTGKSTFCSILGGPYYTDIHLDPHSKDTVSALRGKSVVECSEMVFNKKSDIESIKSFLSKTVDNVRLPYGRLNEDIPRSCIFIGTTNESGSYFKDHTGNRRFYPIRTNGFKLDDFRRDLDQIYAEAFYAWRAGEATYITDLGILKMAKEEQDMRFNIDPWAEIIMNWLQRESMEGREYDSLSTISIASDVFNFTSQQLDRIAGARIKQSMESLGWEPARVYEDGVRRVGYRRKTKDD